MNRERESVYIWERKTPPTRECGGVLSRECKQNLKAVKGKTKVFKKFAMVGKVLSLLL